MVEVNGCGLVWWGVRMKALTLSPGRPSCSRQRQGLLYQSSVARGFSVISHHIRVHEKREGLKVNEPQDERTPPLLTALPWCRGAGERGVVGGAYPRRADDGHARGWSCRRLRWPPPTGTYPKP